MQKRLNAQLAEKKAKEQEQEKQLADMQSKLEAFHAKQLEAQKAHAGAEETLSNELAEVQAVVVKERKERWVPVCASSCVLPCASTFCFYFGDLFICA